MTIGNYPLKADEYLAMGKPMVATRTDGMKMFEGHVSLCGTAEEYIAAIGKYLAAPPDGAMRESWRAFAAGHTWENCVGVLDEALTSHITKTNDHEK